MTSPVGVIGLAYDGYDLQRADLNVMFAITEGLDELPVVRGESDLIPFRSGRLPVAGFADHRPIVATGWVAGAAPAPESSYQAYLDGLKAVLDPTRLPALLVATLTDDTNRWIPAVPRSLMGGEMIGHEFRPLSIAWEALDPYWYSPYGVAALDSGLFLDDGESLDQGATLLYAPTSTIYDVPLTIPGTADSERVRIELTGPSTSMVSIDVVDVVGAPLIGFTYPTLTVGQTLLVDNYARTVMLGGLSMRANLTLREGNLHGEYIRLSPGFQHIRIGGKPLQARLLFMPTYL